MNGRESISNELRRDLLRKLIFIRTVEETIALRYAEQQMRCPVHLSTGQEGVAVGACAALDERDYVMSTHRAHAHYLAKGGDLRRMLAEIYGRVTGCCGGKGGSMHLVDLEANFLGSTPIVGSSLPVAVGSAFGSWLDGQDRVTLVFFGEGSTEEGIFAESLNFAALKNLPIVFVCEDNLYSVYSPLSVRQPSKRDILAIAKAHGIDGRRGDGNDVEQVLSETTRAVSHARAGGGPTILLFSTYRWREHCGPNFDNDIGYRTETEFLTWKEKCPVATYSARLVGEGVLDASGVVDLEKTARDNIDAAFVDALDSPFPDQVELFTDLYANG